MSSWTSLSVPVSVCVCLTLWSYLLRAPRAWTGRESRRPWRTGRRSGRAARPGRGRAPSRLQMFSVLCVSLCASSPLLPRLLSSVCPELRLSSLRGSLISKRWRQFKASGLSWLSRLTFGLRLAKHLVNTAQIITLVDGAAALGFRLLLLMSLISVKLHSLLFITNSLNFD